MTTSLLHARAGLHVMGHSARRALAPNFSTNTMDVNGVFSSVVCRSSRLSIVARRHDINANQLFTWRRIVAATPSAAEGEATRLAPAVVTAESPAVSATSGVEGRIEIALAGGDRVIVDSMVDATALAP
jgi:transposase